MEKREKFVLLFWLFFSIFVGIESVRLGLGRFNAPGPGFLPFGVSLCLIAAVIILFLKNRKKEILIQSAPLFRKDRIQKVFYILCVLFLYGILLEKLGVILCTLFLLGSCLKMIEPQRWKTVIIITLSTTFFSYIVFSVWLKIPFPRGSWLTNFFPR